MSLTAAQTAAYRAKRRAAGLCWHCASPASEGTLCARHAEINRARKRAWCQAQKEAQQ